MDREREKERERERKRNERERKRDEREREREKGRAYKALYFSTIYMYIHISYNLYFPTFTRCK